MDNGNLIVVALGGNAISNPDAEGNIEEQFESSKRTAHHLANLIDMGHRLVITHGNGPQVGNALLRNQGATDIVYPLPMPSVVASVEGGMGYMIAQTLMNELRDRGTERAVTTIVTTILVDPTDPSFEIPSKPIGQSMTADQAKKAMGKEEWTVAQVEPGLFRRVVPSPTPISIVEFDAIRTLVESNQLVIACGGGGVPVIRNAQCQLESVHAVIDKDLASALLAAALGADKLFIFSNIDRVAIDFKTPNEREIDHMTVTQAQHWLDEGQFPPGSMGPKIQGALNFLNNTPHDDPEVRIGPLERAAEVYEGTIGTRITRG